MDFHYAHQSKDSQAFKTVTTIYQRLLEEWPGAAQVRRAGAYLETVDRCRRDFGESSAELVAALDYLTKWLAPIEPRRATNAYLALMQAQIRAHGRSSNELVATLADFHKFLATQGERISHANFPFNALEGEVDPANLIFAPEPFGYSAALAPLLECLNARVDESYEVPDVPLKWGSVSLTNLTSALHEGLVLRPNRELSQREQEVTAISAMRAGKERNNKAYPLFLEIQERTASVFKDLLQIGPLVQSGCVLSQVPESCHEGLSLSILLGDQEREFNRNPEGFNHHDIRHFSLYDNSLDERDLNKVRFDYFTNIKTIDVSGNFLTRLPRVLSRLPTLESLDLSRNRSLELEAS